MRLLADSLCAEDLVHRWSLLVALCGGRRQEGLGNVWCSITALMLSLKVPPPWASLVTQLVKNPPAVQETQVRFPGLGRSPIESNQSNVQLLKAVKQPYFWASLIAQVVKNLLAMQDTCVPSLGWEDSPGEGKGYPLQYSGLENSTDCIANGVTKSQARLNDFHFPPSGPVSSQ